MNLRQNKSRFAVFALALSAMGAFGQTQDNSQNGLLKGVYNFRHIAVQNVDSNNDPSEVTATFGTITFDGNGNFSVSATVIDNTVSSGAPQPLTGTGSYAIGANGLGYVANPLYINPTDTYDLLYGAVSQGVFIGSATEAYGEQFILNDLFIAIPAGNSPTNASFTAAYQTGVLDFANGNALAIKNALFNLSPNGKGAFGTISLSGQASNQTAPNLTQSITGATYNFNSDGSATLTVPLPSGVTSANALFTGTKTIFASADGNFILGWTSGGYDIFFGVKALAAGTTVTSALTNALYFTAALEDSAGTGYGTDSYYGGTSTTADSAGDAIMHQHLNYPFYYSEDYGANDKITVNGGSASDTIGYSYLFGDGGNAFVGIGSGGYYSLVVGLHAAAFSGTGVYINPVGIVNAASWQPVTASIAPGELLTIYNSPGIASTTAVTAGGQPFPTTLGGVTVTINNIPCPIYYVSPTQISFIAPYALYLNTQFLANIQVTNNKVQSNIVQMYLTDAAPGSFSQRSNGLGLASALHAATGQLITTANPAQPGEYISLYLTGLGTVSPAITDGALGPTNPLSTADVNTAGNLTVYFNDDGPNGSASIAGTITYAGLAPGLAGLYQINVQVPSSGLSKGDDVNVAFSTQYAYFDELYIPYGPGAAADRPAPTPTLARRSTSIHSQRKPAAKHKSRVEVDLPRAARP